MTDSNNQQPPLGEEEAVSKSEMKREMDRLQQLGDTLTHLSPEQWKDFGLSDTLIAAMHESKRIKQHGAKKRHLQYIGKLMREENIEDIRERLALLDPGSEAYGRRQRHFEMWRTQLIQQPDAMNQFIDLFPQVDRQQLRNLVRNAQKAAANFDNPTTSPAAKKLFQLIKEVVE